MPEIGILARARGTEFFPGPGDLARALRERGEVCLGTKSRNLGDALALTTLPARLKRRYPGLRVTVHARGFNPVVFLGNPAVDGLRQAPPAVFGDDGNEGTGALIERKERWFGVDAGAEPRPEIHLLESERRAARRLLAEKTETADRRKPLVLLHPWGRTNAHVMPVEDWDALVHEHRGRFRFWQIGLHGHSAVQGCEYYLFSEPGRWHARRLFAVIAHAARFVGVDSGPMHVARAFHVPSLVLTPHADPEALRARAAARPARSALTPEELSALTLYPGNRHAATADALGAARDFLRPVP